jgi:hypothetical protein
MSVVVGVILATAITTVAGNNETDLGLFDIPFCYITETATTLNGTTDYNDIMDCLYEGFDNTDGLVAISLPTNDPSDEKRFDYFVIYNKTQLNVDGSLADPTIFISSFQTAIDTVSSCGNIQMNSSATRQAMSQSVDAANMTMYSTNWACVGNKCPQGSTCVWYDVSGKAECQSSCYLFTGNNSRCTQSPSLPGVYLKGSCVVDDDTGMAYCNCGYSTGNVIPNFYDGTQCVSSTFIVAMSASAGGLVLVLCIFLICTINAQRDAVAAAKDAAVKYKLSTPPVIDAHHEEGNVNKAMYEYDDANINAIVRPEVHRTDSRPHSEQQPYYDNVVHVDEGDVESDRL